MKLPKSERAKIVQRRKFVRNNGSIARKVVLKKK